MTGPFDLSRRLAAKGLGTAFLFAAVVGSGIMGERLANGNIALALLANSLATAAVLYVVIEWFGPISGAHFNLAVTVAMAIRGDIAWPLALAYVPVQIAAAIIGVMIANLMFELPIIEFSRHARTGASQWVSEGVATFGLVGVIWVCSRSRPKTVAGLVAAYIGGAYWFTGSTSFANPAVTIARALTDSFAGIRPADVFGFMVSQVMGAGAAIAVFGWLVPMQGSSTAQFEPQRALEKTAI